MADGHTTNSSDGYTNRYIEYMGAILAFLLAMLFLYISYKFTVSRRDNKKSEDVIDAPDGTYTACASPECVRCTKYSIVRKTATCRILDCKLSQGEDISRLIQAVQEPIQYKYKSQRPNVFYIPNLRGCPWWEDAAFTDQVTMLEANFEMIKKEFWSVYYEELVAETSWTSNRTTHGAWHTFYLYNQGQQVTENCELCPHTCKLLHQVHNFMSRCIFGNALFSVLDPDTHIQEHCGPTNIRIRCHLGLSIPPACSLTVNEDTRGWREGKCTIFDDSFEHSARHYGTSGDAPRAVLMLDFWHPDLTTIEKQTVQRAFDMNNT